MIIANRPLNRQALILEEAENKIRETVKAEYLRGMSKQYIDNKIARIIGECLKEISIKELRESAKISLVRFYNRQYIELRRITPLKLAIFIALLKMEGKDITGVKSPRLPSRLSKESARIFLQENGISGVNLTGNALQKYSKDYFDKDIKPVFERLTKQFPLDPDDVSGRMSLRGKAELEVRYQHNLDMVNDLKEEGHRLVICSTHADCSDRCAKWQGRVYSLDGSSGKTDDGRQFIPLEVATDIYYTTKAGKRYKNGLLGFNCRHYLIPYKSGYRFPKPNAQEERKQYAITQKQRELERHVIKWKTEALEYKGIDKETFEKAKRKANEWNKAYIDFSRKNNRAYYPSRTKIL